MRNFQLVGVVPDAWTLPSAPRLLSVGLGRVGDGGVQGRSLEISVRFVERAPTTRPANSFARCVIQDQVQNSEKIEQQQETMSNLQREILLRIVRRLKTTGAAACAGDGLSAFKAQRMPIRLLLFTKP